MYKLGKKQIMQIISNLLFSPKSKLPKFFFFHSLWILGTGEIFWSSLKTCEVDIYWCEIKFRSLFYLHIWISLLGYHTIDLRNLVIFDPFSSMFGKFKKSLTSSKFFRKTTAKEQQSVVVYQPTATDEAFCCHFEVSRPSDWSIWICRQLSFSS